MASAQVEVIMDALHTNWTGAGGTEPTMVDTNTQEVPEGKDYIAGLRMTWRWRARPQNDEYQHKTYNVDLECSSPTSLERLEEIMAEVERILSTDGAITGVDTVRIAGVDYRSSPKNRTQYMAIMTVELVELMSASATAVGSATTYNLGAALMLGSANAAWVPLAPAHGFNAVRTQGFSSGVYSNVGATNDYWMYELVKPTTLGGLKLYINSVRVGVNDADVSNYLDAVTVYGAVQGSAATTILNDSTNRVTVGSYAYAISAHDCSGYEAVRVMLQVTIANAYALDITSVQVRCYYDT